ncbi:hypothetical protein VTL71DRAFT_514 [Oculimacula yallundae]|uniref:J domain-containing protein n=1 Tax=Oculimacula yallundae TaxID=86028 RepID=A0ABR4D2J2_9HELO
MSTNDLQKWVTSTVDFYALLGLTLSTPSSSELRRAYRKTALQYHPDKAGKDYDPEKYELFQAANSILSDPELKAKYDGHRSARLQRERANELFEGKRRKMKEDLEERERGGGAGGGLKRGREEGAMESEMRKLAEEGRKRRAARQSVLDENVASSPAPVAPQRTTEQAQQTQTASTPTHKSAAAGLAKEPEVAEEDEVERLERRIREAEAAKAARKAEKKARKSGIFVPLDSPANPRTEAEGGSGSKAEADLEQERIATATPIKRPDIFRGLKADEQSSASPKFSFSPTIPTPKRNDFAATMARLKAAEKQRMEDEIRKQESEAT